MASIPLDLSTTRSSRKTTPLKMIPTFEQPRWHLMPNPGILLIKGNFSSNVGLLCFSTKLDDMVE